MAKKTNPRRGGKSAFLCLLLLTGAGTLPAQDTRSLGMAGTSMVLARGTDAPLWNPANLALPRASRWSLTVVNLSATGSNSSFPKRYYDKYNGAYLDDAAKNDILSRISDSGLGVIANAQAQLFSIAYKQYALSIIGSAAARAAAPRDIFDLILFGNQMNRDYTAAGAGAHALSTASLCLSAALPVRIPWFTLKASAAGITLKYHYGVGYAELLDATLASTTTASFAAASGRADFRFGMLGGHGFSADLGFAADIDERWSLSLAWSDIVGTVHFGGDSYRGSYSFSVDSLNALSFEDTDLDSIIRTEHKEEENISFFTSIPSEIRLGGGYRLGSVTFTAVCVQGFRRTGRVSSTPGLAVGGEYQPWKLLQLRTGIGIGGVQGFRLAWGLSFRPGPFRLDLAFQNVGGITAGQSRGISAGVALGFEW